MDIDRFLEYDNGKAAALIEYKHEFAQEVDPRKDKSILALKDLANRARLPFFGVRYARDFSWWLVVPLNDEAKGWLAKRKKMAEIDWVKLLYKIRGRQIPQEILGKIASMEYV